MTGREYRVSVFEDTQEKIKGSEKLTNSINKTLLKQAYVKGRSEVAIPKRLQYTTSITVTRNRTMEAARNWANKGNTAVLNFASATNPGGGVVKGSSAQEECLCRVSTLYNCLNDLQAWEKFYNPNRALADVIHDDKIIYSPKVCVLKSDDYYPFEENEYFYVDVISCAAPNLREVPNNGWCNVGESNTPVQITDEKLFDIHLQRARTILETAMQHNIKNLVLGAFGCGAFRNNPVVVAKAWHKAVDEFNGCFENIEFAVYCKDFETVNYEAFVKEFIKTE